MRTEVSKLQELNALCQELRLNAGFMAQEYCRANKVKSATPEELINFAREQIAKVIREMNP